MTIDEEIAALLPELSHPALHLRVQQFRKLLTSWGTNGNTSDGYHTFDELYEHRMALTAALCRALEGKGATWRSKNHAADGEPMFDGFFIVGIELPQGVVTYHYKLEHWDLFNRVPEVGAAPAWDGHTPADVVRRLEAYGSGADRRQV